MKGKTCGDYGGMTKAGKPCKNPAGLRTNHPGEGKCYLPGHGGCSYGRPITNGRQAKKTSRQLHDKIQRHLNDPNPLDLTGELALLRSLIDHFMEKLDEAEAKKAQIESEYTPVELKNQNAIDPITAFVAMVNPLIDNLRKVADTISKIQSRELLTAAELTLVVAVLATVLREEVTDEHVLKSIFGKLRSRLQVPRLAGGADILDGE